MEKLRPKIAYKDIVAVRHDGSMKTLQANDFLDEGGCNALGSVRVRETNDGECVAL